MKYRNDFEVDRLREVPLFVGAAIRAKRCIKCGKVVFANYAESDYECMKCRKD